MPIRCSSCPHDNRAELTLKDRVMIPDECCVVDVWSWPQNFDGRRVELILKIGGRQGELILMIDGRRGEKIRRRRCRTWWLNLADVEAPERQTCSRKVSYILWDFLRDETGNYHWYLSRAWCKDWRYVLCTSVSNVLKEIKCKVPLVLESCIM